ncbi:MAG: metal ABC transporter permease [Alphaproteobacteria bacterium]|nr:metal ABC transporter permease [Alphaproteobacteria bacterium]
MIDVLLEPLQWPFMQYAFGIALIVSLPTALLSCFLILRGWSLMGDAISHAVLPGIVVAYIINIPLIVGAFGAGLVCSGLIGYIGDHSRVKRDTVMGVVFSGMFALGMVLYVKIESAVHLNHILFGDIMGISRTDLWQSGTIALLVVGFIVLKWRDLLLCSFDATQAKASGLSTRWLHYALLMMLSLTIVATLKSAGIILAIALLIAPGAIAFLCTQRFSSMMCVAVVVTLSASFIGVYSSFFLDSAPAPTIVVVLSVMFKFVFWRQMLYRRIKVRALASAV